MKNQNTTTKVFSHVRRLGSTLAAVVLAIAASSASGQVLAPATAASGQVLAPTSHPYGLSYQEWSAKWWQWSLQQSTNHLQAVGGPGICDGPASHVQFLLGAYLTGGTAIQTNHITIPAGTPLFFSVLSTWADNSGCPTFTTLSAAELAAQVSGSWSGVTLTTCTIDGVAVPGLGNPATSPYVVNAPAFSYTTAETDNVLAGIFGETCIDGDTTIYPAVAEGAYLMLAPLAPGKHTIHTVGQVSIYVDLDITYEITVQRDGGCDRH
jgi:hypothetical protein